MMADAASSLLGQLLGLADLPPEGEGVLVRGQSLVMDRGMLRQKNLLSESQEQTAKCFGYKWQRRDDYESAEVIEKAREWMLERYGDLGSAPWWPSSASPVLLDAGCGAGFSALALLKDMIPSLRYLGVDISSAVDVARKRFAENGIPGTFLQADISNLPMLPSSIDVIFSEGVMHHTDSTEATMKSLVKLLKTGGLFLFYVYRVKGPIREFSDDLIRSAIADLPPEQGWEKLMPLTRLGKVLGDLNIEVDVPEDIEILQIPAGKIPLQRLVYWHIFKAYYRPEMSLEEMNVFNFDWYSPKNAHRHTPEEVSGWCQAAGLSVLHQKLDEAGITVVARKTI